MPEDREKKLRQVVVVAVEGHNHDWAAYMENGFTREQGHTLEAVASHGTKLEVEMAEYLFPEFADHLTYRP